MEEEKNQNFQTQFGQKPPQSEKNPETPLISAPEPKSKYWKFVLWFLVIIVAAFILYPALNYFYDSYRANKSIKDYQQWEKEYLEAQKNDTFGGKTPQETYEKFVATLKKGDILEAAKYYFDDQDRINAYKRFLKMQNDGTLSEWMANLPQWNQLKEVDYWDKDGKRFIFDYVQKEDYTFFDVALDKNRTIPAGKYQGYLIFQLNTLANIWKIYNL